LRSISAEQARSLLTARKTAFPHDALSPGQQQQIISDRRACDAEVRHRQRRGVRKARTRPAPMTASSPAPAEVTVLDEQALSSCSRRREETLSSQARIDPLVPPGAPRAIK
jgi:hypothetical protein